MARSGSRVLVEIHMADKNKLLRDSSWITIIFLLILVQKKQKINWKAANYLDFTFFPTHQCFSRPLTTVHWLFKASKRHLFCSRTFPDFPDRWSPWQDSSVRKGYNTGFMSDSSITQDSSVNLYCPCNSL